MDMRDDRSEPRVMLLRELIAKHRTVAEFCRTFKINATYVSQILNGRRAFGHRAAKKMGMQIAGNPAFFDSKVTASSMIAFTPTALLPGPSETAQALDVPDGEVSALLQAYSKLSDKERARLLIEAEYKDRLADLDREDGEGQ